MKYEHDGDTNHSRRPWTDLKEHTKETRKTWSPWKIKPFFHQKILQNMNVLNRKDNWFDLVSLLNRISNFGGYLMPKPSFSKTSNGTFSWEIRGPTFLLSGRLQLNRIALRNDIPTKTFFYHDWKQCRKYSTGTSFSHDLLHLLNKSQIATTEGFCLVGLISLF